MTSRIDIIKGEKDKFTLEKKNEIVAKYEEQIAISKALGSDTTEQETILAEIKANLF